MKASRDSFASAVEAHKKRDKEAILSAAQTRQHLYDSLYTIPMNKCGLYAALIRCSSVPASGLKENLRDANMLFRNITAYLDSATKRNVIDLLSFYKDISSKLEQDNSTENRTKCNLSLSFSQLKVKKLGSSLCNLK